MVQVELKTSNGSTALHNAANCGHAAVVKQLLQAGASISQCALTGANALFNAATAGQLTSPLLLHDCIHALLSVSMLLTSVATRQYSQRQVRHHCDPKRKDGLSCMILRFMSILLSCGQAVLSKCLQPRQVCKLL